MHQSSCSVFIICEYQLKLIEGHYLLQCVAANVGRDGHILPTPRATSQKADITRCTLEAACWLGPGAGETTLRKATLTLVYSTAQYCAGAWCRFAYTCVIYPVTNDALRNVTGCLCPKQADNLHILSGIQLAELHRRGATLSLVRTKQCHGTCTSASLSSDLYTGWECTAFQIETHFCTRLTTTHQFIWQQQQKCVALGGSPMECGVVGRPYENLYLHPNHRRPPSHNGLPRTACVRLKFRTVVGLFRSCLR